MLKRAVLVAGTYVLSIVLVLLCDRLLSLLFHGDFVRGGVPSTAALAASTAPFAVVAAFCGWLCARLAPGGRSCG